ncbi:putative type I restriction enzyme S subunit [Clostridium botulinum]|uniref:restriction endonuclease subunit S n=1 Tax=Clostridium botulinum TaxID=1491 RepID=UPI000581E7BF|nr:restriction endonuclease subunit S [Clostridium botulinum]BAQ13883.1 putative type I restriction enzyme S subunit [Clostridium botulinum]
MNKVPKLRFPEFSGEWKEKKCGNLFDKIRNRVDVEENKSYKQIGIRSHGKGIFYKEEVTGKELGNKRVFWVEPNVFIVNIVFAWERAVARTTENEIGMIASHRFPMYKPKKEILDLGYITYFFKTNKGKALLVLASPGGAGRNKTLGQKEFDNLKIILPKVEEQKKIGSIILLIDKKIEKQQEKVEALKDYKKGMMQKIFSQEIRFKGDNGEEYQEWKEKRLGDVTKIYDGTHQTPKYVKEGIKFLSVENIRDFDSSNKYITEEAYYKEFKIKPQRNDVLMTRIGDIGTSNIVCNDNKYAFYVSLALIRCNNDMLHPDFLNQYIASEYFQRELYRKTIHVAFPKKINLGEIGFCSVVLLNVKEQQKIANFLSKIDDKLNKEKEKLDLLKKLKKGLLQQMFV